MLGSICTLEYLKILKTLILKQTNESYLNWQMSSAAFQDKWSIYKNQFYFYRLAKKHSENEIKKTAPFTSASKRMEYSGINLTKEV